MQIFHYDPTTRQLTGEGVADADPMQPGEWLLPAHSTATPAPTVARGQAAVYDATADAWAIVDVPAPPPIADDTPQPVDLAASVRAVRNKALAECDWVVLRARDRGEAVPSEWLVYREALRAVPQQSGFPEVLAWPGVPHGTN